MRSKWVRLGTLLTVGASVLALASFGSTATASTKARATVVTGILPVADAGGFFTAEARGYFAKYGIIPKAQTIAGGATLVPALESGAMNMGFSNIVSVLQAGQAHLPVECVAGTLRKPRQGANLPLVVSPKYASTITSASGLVGQKIAVNTLGNINQLVADVWLADHGVNPSSVTYVGIAFPDMPAAIAQGEVAAAITDEPFSTIVVAAGAKILAPDPYSLINPSPVFSCWVAATSWVNAHKTVVRDYVKALNEATAYIAAHPNYLRSILPKYTSLSKTLANSIVLPTIISRVSVSDLKVWETPALKYGFLSHSVNLKSLIAKLG